MSFKKMFLNIAYEFGRGSGNNQNPYTYDECHNFEILKFIEMGDISAIVSHFKAWEVNLNSYASKGSPLHVSIIYERYDIMDVLLAGKANPNELLIVDDQDKILHPLNLLVNKYSLSFGNAVELKRIENAMSAILDYGADPDFDLEYSNIFKKVKGFNKYSHITTHAKFLSSDLWQSYLCPFKHAKKENFDNLVNILSKGRLENLKKSS